MEFPWLSEDVAFLYSSIGPIIVCVCVCVYTCVCVCVYACVYKYWGECALPMKIYKVHVHTRPFCLHTRLLPKLTQPICHTPDHLYQRKCEEHFSCILIYFLCFVCLCSLASTLGWSTGVVVLFPQRTIFSLPRGTLNERHLTKKSQNLIKDLCLLVMFYIYIYTYIYIYETLKQIAFMRGTNFV